MGRANPLSGKMTARNQGAGEHEESHMERGEKKMWKREKSGIVGEGESQSSEVVQHGT